MVESAVHVTSWLVPLLSINFALMGVRLAVRTAASGRLYGWPFALLVPVRFFWANFLNAAATFRAFRCWLAAKLRGERLAWVKTSHAYPTRGALLTHKKALSEVMELLELGPAGFFDEALTGCPEHMRPADFLVEEGLVTEDQLMEALCLQHSLPRAHLDEEEISVRIRRTIPLRLAEDWRIVPFRIADGALHVATAEIPTDEMLMELRRYTRLDIRFYLISTREYYELHSEVQSF